MCEYCPRGGCLLERAGKVSELRPSLSDTQLLSGLDVTLGKLRERGASAQASARPELADDGARAATALITLGERWLAAGSAKEGIAKLPADVVALLSDATALDMLERL